MREVEDGKVSSLVLTAVTTCLHVTDVVEVPPCLCRSVEMLERGRAEREATRDETHGGDRLDGRLLPLDGSKG